MRKLNPRGWHLWWVARLVADMADEDKENFLVERQPKCAKLPDLSLPKDQFSIMLDKDLEEVMKTCSVKMALNNRWAAAGGLSKTLRTGLKQSGIKLKCY